MVGVASQPHVRTQVRPDDRRAELAAFLHYGYRPLVPPGYLDRPWSRVRASDAFALDGIDRDALVRRGVQAFRAACAPAADRRHVVPLSAGIDSRLLLGTLVELVPRERIVAVTFGVPGALDFDLAPAVARAAGVRHEAIDLTGLAVTRDELLATARAAPWTFVHEAYPNHLIPRRHGPDATYWSGCMANSFAGADLAVPATTMAEARREFAHRTRISRTLCLTPPDFDPTSVLPETPLLEDGALTLYEQLYAYLRYPGFNDPILLAPGHAWRTPFREPAWVDFMLRVPRTVRADPSFYRSIAARPRRRSSRCRRRTTSACGPVSRPCGGRCAAPVTSSSAPCAGASRGARSAATRASTTPTSTASCGRARRCGPWSRTRCSGSPRGTCSTGSTPSSPGRTTSAAARTWAFP